MTARMLLGFFIGLAAFSASSAVAAATLSGTVLGNGSPLDASVRVYGGSFDNTVSTDANGNYSVSGLSLGNSYLLDITPAQNTNLKPLIGYALTMNQETQTADFNLTSSYGFFTVSGYLKSDEGYAISSSMRITDDCCQYSGSSNSDGLYSIANVKEGEDLTISTYADSAIVRRSPVDAVLVMFGTWSQNSQTFDLTADTTLSDIVIDLIYVEGVVSDEAGNPVEGASVQARGGSGFRGTTTDASGRYAIALYADQASTVLKIEPNNDSLSFKQIDLPLSGSDVTLPITLDSISRYTVSGYLKSDEGYAISSSMRITDDCCQYSGSSNSDGLYSIANVKEGEDLTISTYADSAIVRRSPVDAVLVMFGTWSQNSQTFDLTADTTLSDIVIDLIYVEGVVSDEAGNPVEGASVQARGGSGFRGTTTDASGRYAIALYADQASTVLKIEPNNDSLSFKQIDLPLSGSDVTLPITLDSISRYTVSGYLKSDEGYAISSSMRITDDCCQYSGSSNSDGLYSIANVKEGEDLTISTYADSAIVRRSPVDAVLVMFGTWSQNSQTFDLTADTTLSDIVIDLQYIDGKVIDSNGVGIEGVSVQARGGSGYRGTTTDEEGRYGIALYSSQTETELNFTSSYTGLKINESISRSLTGADQNLTLVLPFTDTKLPKFLSPPQVAAKTQQSVTLLWSTDEPAQSNVAGSGFSSVSNSEYRVSHEVTLTGLSASTSYTATVAVTDRSGNGPVEASVSFTTPAAPDTAPPVITVNPVIASITDNSMVVQWSTNEPALTALQWGASNLSNTTQPDAVYRTEHEITLTGLTGLTDYQVRASATDIEGNGPTVSPTVTVKTLTAPDATAPAIKAGPFISNVTDTEAMVSWVTNEPAVSGVSLNDGTAYVVYRDEDLVTEHAVRLTGLSASTTYYYTVSSTDEAGNGPTLSTEDSFITQAAADTSPPQLVEATKVVGVTHQSAVLHFQTDEPSSVTLSYGVTQDQLDKSVSVAKLSNRHVIQLSDLDSDQTYYFSARLTDSSANSVAQPAESFKTRPSAPISAPTYVAEPTVFVSGDGRALIRWDTSEATQCSVTFGISGSSEERRLDIAGKRTSHQAMLTELLPGRLYSFSLTCRNVAGVAATYNSTGDGFGSTPSSATEWLFAVVNNFFFNQAFAQTRGSFSFSQQVDSTSPVLLDSEFLHRNAENIVVRLRFDKPATVEARYGVSLLNKSVSSETFKLEHVLVLAGLVADQQYTIEFRARDISGNASTSVKSSESSGSQQDESAPTLVGSPEFNQDSATGVSVYFLTDEYSASSVSCARVDTGAAFTQGIEGLGKSHPIFLQDIDPNTNYDCVVRAVDTSNNKLISEPYRLAMGSAPAVAYTVTPSADVNGQIFPSWPQVVAEDGSKSFTLTANSGYVIDVVEGNCAGSLAGSVYTVTSVTDNCTVDAKFKVEPVVVHVVTPAARSGGSIAPSSPTSVANLNRINFTVKPNGGYKIASVGGTCGGSLSGNTYTTNAVTAACTVEASFTEITYDVTPSAGANGSISPATAQTIAQGATTTFTVTPDEGYSAAVAGSCGGASGWATPIRRMRLLRRAR